MNPIIQFFLGIFLLVQGVEWLGWTFSGNKIVKGICLAIAGALMVFYAL